MKLRAFGSKKTPSDDVPSDDVQHGESDSASKSAQNSSTEFSGDQSVAASRHPAKKGRPTPRRRDQERARGLHSGPVTAPVTRKEAKERRKATESSMSKEERKAHRAKLRAEREERRQLMMNGDDRYVLSRDRGEVRRYVRNWVDTHRRIINVFMPLALFVIIFQLIPNRELMALSQTMFLALIAVIIVDGILLGRSVNKSVRERFPDSDDHGFGLGWYAVMRATQPRMLRTPRPHVRPGDDI